MAVWSTVSFSALTDDRRIDAEHYRPECLAQAKRIAALPHKLLSEIADISDGNHVSIAESFTDDGVRYLRGQDLADFFIADKTPVFIPESTYETLKRSHMRPGDILLGIVATIGTVSLVTDRFGKLTGNCKIGIIRPKKIESEFLATFFLSALGQREIHRWARGTVQTGVILPDLKKLPIPIVSEPISRSIAERVRAAHSRKQECERLLAEAEAMLNEAVGLADLDLTPRLFYEARFADASAAARLDAEYFQPKYKHLLDRLGRCNKVRSVPIREFCSRPKYGTSEKLDYTSTGVPFLRIADLEGKRFDLNSVRRIAPEIAVTLREKVHVDDVLISRSGTLGVAVPIETAFDGAVYGSYFIKTRPDTQIVHPEYLSLFINSLAGQTQIEQLNTGGIQTNLTIAAIENIRVAVGPMDWQMQFVKKVAASLSARRESRRLLDTAKRAVEIAIEESEAAALRFLEEARG